MNINPKFVVFVLFLTLSLASVISSFWVSLYGLVAALFFGFATLLSMEGSER